MKKYFIVCVFLLLGAIVFSLSSCIEENSSSQKIKELRFNIKVNNPTITKAVKTGWEDGDKGLSNHYGDISLELLYTEFNDKLRYEGLDLSHLYVDQEKRA